MGLVDGREARVKLCREVHAGMKFEGEDGKHERKKKKEERKLRLFMEMEGGATQVAQACQGGPSSRATASKRETMSSRGLPSYLVALSTNHTSAFHTIVLMYNLCTPILRSYIRLITVTMPLSEAISRQTSQQSLCETPGSSFSHMCPR